MDNSLSKAQVAYLRARSRHKRLVLIGQILLFILFIGAWELTARIGLLNDFIFSSPSRMITCFIQMTEDFSIFRHIGVTLAETIGSFFLVMAIGLLAAMLLWLSPTLSELLEPYLVMLNSLPKSALAPVLIVWLGNNVKTIVVAAISVAVFGSIMTLHTGFRSVDQDKIKLIYTLGGRKRDVLKKVLVPSAVPLIINNMKVNIGLCLVGVIIGEFLAADKGLGYLIIYGSQVFKMDIVMMSIVILCIISMGLYRIIGMLEKRYVKRH
ncbi:ABC transporter permease [Qiania dongpingensis]|uniref:ABC transporter permease n=1 Tax=Qiania dongpingensis TaxID=2763669 RepID=A0A7G9G654_9FIRM|nr:ABC transporter permease [Qiania dongpingensis]QNM06286.1 ABC transporter permease [Qiania dongpingensis]